jgi:putative transposase
MATFRRSLTPGATYFFTVTTYQRQRLLTRSPFVKALKQSIADVQQAMPFTIDAIVLLPDHLHCIWTLPSGDADYAIRWNRIKRAVSQSVSEHLIASASASMRKRRELGLWQRRFWEHQIRDERDLARHVDYIHWNPVKHGYVTRVIDWPYSSLHRYVKQAVYPENWGGGEVEGEFGE